MFNAILLLGTRALLACQLHILREESPLVGKQKSTSTPKFPTLANKIGTFTKIYVHAT